MNWLNIQKKINVIILFTNGHNTSMGFEISSINNERKGSQGISFLEEKKIIQQHDRDRVRPKMSKPSPMKYRLEENKEKTLQPHLKS